MENFTSILKLLRLKPHKKIPMENISEAFAKENYHNGRMISYSKSMYRQKHPENEVYFNANIFTLNEGKIWYGDIDVTLDREILQRISDSIGTDLFILRELDGRFENEDLKDSEIIKRSVATIKHSTR